MKGNASCHTTNKKYREGYDAIFGKKKKEKHEYGEHDFRGYYSGIKLNNRFWDIKGKDDL